MLVIVAFFTMGYVERSRSHIIIDLVVSRFRKRAQDVICTIMYLFFLVTSCLLTWRLGLDAVSEQHSGSIISTTLAVPTSPFIFAAAFGCALLSLMVLVHLLLFLAGAASK
jgi:TRAP-type C4-dicarboxylate transport system permease small subunit